MKFSINELTGIIPNASEHGTNIDHMLEFCHWFMAALFVGWTTYFFYTVWRFNAKRNPKANYYGVKSKASVHLEASVVLIEAVILLGFALPLWGARVAPDTWPDKEKALRIRAIGEQFAWNFHYPGPDGVFGRQDNRLISAQNSIGLDNNDPAAADDIVTKGELALEQYRPTVIEITSKDVIHSLSLHTMRMTQDAIPGSVIPMWFRPVKKGEFEIVCAQLCGANHYAMKAMMTTYPKAEFEAWQKEKLELKKSAAPAAPVAQVSSGFDKLAQATTAE
jgi:cytochrome c oxidase subunit II